MKSEKEIVPLRNRKGSIYQRGSNEVFKISRSKFSNFVKLLKKIDEIARSTV